MCVNCLSGIDYGALDQGGSLSTSDRVVSVMGSQPRIKGT